MSQKKFTKPKFFERIGRMMLARLLERFQQELVGAGIVLPDPALEDKEYYAALSKAAIRGPGLPEAFREVLHRVAEMANTTARGRLIRAAERVGLQLERNQTCTDADLAVQVLLADENLFTEQHSETHIMNLSTFEYHACREGVDRSQMFRGIDDEQLRLIKGDIDTWLTEEREGDERVTEIEVFEIDGEDVLSVRHGTAPERRPIVEDGRAVVRYQRPLIDLIAIYTPARDEVRVNARSVGERKMIRRVLGERLFGNP